MHLGRSSLYTPYPGSISNADTKPNIFIIYGLDRIDKGFLCFRLLAKPM